VIWSSGTEAWQLTQRALLLERSVTAQLLGPPPPKRSICCMKKEKSKMAVRRLGHGKACRVKRCYVALADVGARTGLKVCSTQFVT